MNPLPTEFYVQVCNNFRSVVELQHIVGSQSLIFMKNDLNEKRLTEEGTFVNILIKINVSNISLSF